MPRCARRLGDKGYLHVIARGNGQQIIFEDDQDYYFYIKLMSRNSKELDITICSYCLMSNHVHMLIYYSEHDNVAEFMKKIGIRYSYYYNKKYDRTGHLFQGRYKSELVDSEEYFLSVNRYILQNPLKAGISTVRDYPWSSYNIYDRKNSFVDASLFIDLLGGHDCYLEYVNATNEDVCMEYCYEKRSDKWAIDKMKSLLNVESGNELRMFSKEARDKAIRALKSEGLSVRQIARLTGIGRGTIQKA